MTSPIKTLAVFVAALAVLGIACLARETNAASVVPGPAPAVTPGDVLKGIRDRIAKRRAIVDADAGDLSVEESAIVGPQRAIAAFGRVHEGARAVVVPGDAVSAQGRGKLPQQRSYVLMTNSTAVLLARDTAELRLARLRVQEFGADIEDLETEVNALRAAIPAQAEKQK